MAAKFFNHSFIISIRIPPIKYMSYLYLLVHQSNLQVFHLEDIFHTVHGFSKGLRQVVAGSCSGSWLGASPFLLFVFRLRSLRRNLRIVILLSCLFLSVSELQLTLLQITNALVLFGFESCHNQMSKRIVSHTIFDTIIRTYMHMYSKLTQSPGPAKYWDGLDFSLTISVYCRKKCALQEVCPSFMKLIALKSLKL